MTDALLTWAMRWQVPPAALAELRALVAPDRPEAGDADGAEASVVRACRLEADAAGGHLWRNNSGATRDVKGRMIRYGLGNDSKKLNERYKSSDLIGISPRGLFTAFECKAPGWKGVRTDRERAQENYMKHVRALGGVAAFITDAAQIREHWS